MEPESPQPSSRPGAGGRRIFRNLGALSAARIASDLGSAVLFVALSRAYGQEGIGQYSFAMALTGLFALLGDFGLQGLSIKEVSRRPQALRHHLGEVLLLRLLLSGASFALLLALLPLLPLGAEGRQVVALVGAFQLAYRLGQGLLAAYVADERMGVVALLELGLRIASAAGAVALARSGAGLVSAVAVLPAVAAVQVLVTGLLVCRRYGCPRLGGALGGLPRLVRRALPFAASSLLFQLQARMDVFFLGLWVGMSATGAYNAAFRVVFLLSFLTCYAGTALFPAAARLYAGRRDELVALYRRSLRGFVWLAVPAAAGLALVAGELVRLLYGAAFEGAVPLLQGLAALLLLSGLKNLASFFLMSADLEVERVRAQGWATGFGLLAHCALVPGIGLPGAVIATLAAEALLVALLLRALARRLGGAGLAPPLLGSAAGSACFCLPVLLWLPALPAPAVVAGSLAVYSGVLGLGLAARRSLGRRRHQSAATSASPA